MVIFNPEDDRENFCDVFFEFMETFCYEYDATLKDPQDSSTQAMWIEKNNPKIFLGRFPLCDLQRHCEGIIIEAERRTLTFTYMLNHLK